MPAEIGDQRVLQFRIVEREVGAQLGQIEACALGMRSVFCVDRVDRAFPQRLPPRGIGNDRPAGERLLLVRQAIDGVGYFFLAEARLKKERGAADKLVALQLRANQCDQIVRRGRPRLEEASFRWRAKSCSLRGRDSRQRHRRSSADPRNHG